MVAWRGLLVGWMLGLVSMQAQAVSLIAVNSSAPGGDPTYEVYLDPKDGPSTFRKLIVAQFGLVFLGGTGTGDANCLAVQCDPGNFLAPDPTNAPDARADAGYFALNAADGSTFNSTDALVKLASGNGTVLAFDPAGALNLYGSPLFSDDAGGLSDASIGYVVIPEPGTASLLALGLAAIARSRRGSNDPY